MNALEFLLMLIAAYFFVRVLSLRIGERDVSRVRHFFFRRRFGGRTDVARMSRREIFASARFYFTYAAIFLAGCLGIAVVLFRQPPAWEPSSFLLALPFSLALLSLVFLASAVVLFVRGASKGGKDAPPPRGDRDDIME